MTRISLSNNRNFLFAALLGLGTLLLYAPTLFFQFIYYDDNEYVFENLHIQAGLFHPFFYKWLPTAIVSANWHPLTLISHALDWQLFGAWAGGHHLTNVLFHIANALLVYVLFSRMTGSQIKSFIIAGIFAWHPVKVESVAWVAERKDVLSTFFALLCMLRYVWEIEKKKPLIVCLTFFALSLLCKPMYVTLPVILILFDFWPLARKDKNFVGLLIEKIPLFSLAALFCVITIKAQSAGGAIHHFADYPFLIRLANIAQAYWDYLLLFLWPEKLSIFYPYIPNAHVLYSLGLGFILVLITLIFFLNRKILPALWMGWILFGFTLLPVCGIVTVGAHWIACRYLYWPSIGLSIILIWGGEPLLARLKLPEIIAKTLVIGLLGLCMALTSNYLSAWQNSYKLFQQAADAIPNNWVAHVNLRAAYGRDGNHLKAAEHLIDALKIFPDITNRIPMHWLDFYYMGQVHWRKGQIPQAESYLKEADRRLKKEPPENLYPDSMPERNHLAVCLSALAENRPENCRI